MIRFTKKNIYRSSRLPYGPLFFCKSRLQLFKNNPRPQEINFTWPQICFILLAGSLPCLILCVFILYQTYMIDQSVNIFLGKGHKDFITIVNKLTDLHLERDLIKKEIFQIKSSATHSLDILKGKVDTNTDGGFQASLTLVGLITVGFLIYLTGK